MAMTDEHAQKCLTFLTALQDCYRNEEDRELDMIGKLELSNESLTDDFIAIIQAMYALYKNFTGDTETDLFGFTHIMNRLVFQSLMENNATQRKKDED